MYVDNITSDAMVLNNNGKAMQIKVYEDLLKEKDKEIERLNNIIRDLEVELYAKYHEYKDSECEELYAKSQEDKAIYDYLQELKGVDKE